MTQKPLSVLSQAVSGRVIVELRAGREFRGVLDGFDVHMNLVLKDATEIIDGETIRRSETTIVRGDNVIYISP
ncbi:MAG: small nuclear ribonucleoprotein [Candidatus Thermoplasmatota archaeon]|jgi:small nuclear ribonucleoprotein|nr:small nuclear ribonucleoprotein [Candidatus Thermoplasmatota archaeon]